MINKTLLVIAICMFINGCNTGNNSVNENKFETDLNSELESKRSSLDFDNEIEKWKKELLLNGEVGPPCKDDYQKWTEENPNYYWGMQEIQILESDFNLDKIKDAVCYFYAGNCVGGNGYDSDFAMLIYSHNNMTLTNKNLTTQIEEKIKLELAKNRIYEINDVVLAYKTLTKTIGGSYSAWEGSDANCCPSYRGTYEYDPIDFSIVVKNRKEK
jgi:hypothetical protein